MEGDAGYGLSPRGVRVANSLSATVACGGYGDGGGIALVQVEFERRLGPMVIACRHWRRHIASQCVRHWCRAVVARNHFLARPQAELQMDQLLTSRRQAQAVLRHLWTRWKGWHSGRQERRERIWIALRVSRRLRVALTEWATAAASSAATSAARGHHFAVLYWFVRWRACVEQSAAPFVHVEHRRTCRVATQWLRQARRLAVASHWRMQVAVREGCKHLRRRVLLRWYETAHYAKYSLLIAAMEHRNAALVARCCLHWNRFASGVSLMASVVSMWSAVALSARAERHWLQKRLVDTFRYWADVWLQEAREKAAERVRIDIFVLSYSASRQAREDLCAMRAVVGGWLRYCNDQLAKRTACALADHCFHQNLRKRLTASSFYAWRHWANGRVCMVLCVNAAAQLCRTWLLRRCLVRWLRCYASAAARKRRKLAVSHRKQRRKALVFQVWRCWVRAVSRLIQEAMELADNHARRRVIVCSFRRWSRRARRTASIRNELVLLHIQKVRTRRAFDGLRRAADGLYDLRLPPNELRTPTQEVSQRTRAFARVCLAEACPSPCRSPVAGMHGIIPPGTPQTQRRRLSTSIASCSRSGGANSCSSTGSGHIHTTSPPAVQLFLDTFDERSAEVGTASTPWAKHVANVMTKYDTSIAVTGATIGVGAERRQAQSKLDQAAVESTNAHEVSFDYISVSSLSSISASDEDEPPLLPDGATSTLHASALSCNVLKRAHARRQCAVPLTTGRLADWTTSSPSVQRSLRLLDTNAALPTIQLVQCSPLKKESDGVVRREEQPSNQVLTAAVLGAVQAGAIAWHARHLQRAILRRWALHTTCQVESAALVEQALSLATFHRMGAALSHWRRVSRERPRSQSQPSRKRSSLGAPVCCSSLVKISSGQRQTIEAPMASERCVQSEWNLENFVKDARAMRTRSGDDSRSTSDICSTPPVPVKVAPLAPTPDAFDIEKAMAAIRASRNSRAEA